LNKAHEAFIQCVLPESMAIYDELKCPTNKYTPFGLEEYTVDVGS
jgi:hypothetical protein